MSIHLKKDLPFLIIIVILAYFSIVRNFDAQTINMWDEATYANNAIDMAQNPSIVLRTQGEVDLYSTKPPLVIWMQGMSISLFGINTYAIRLPSILFTIAALLLIYFYSAYYLKRREIGFIAALVFCCTPGFIRNHVALTGDLDAVLSFFLFSYLLYGIWMVQEKKHSIKHFTLLGLFILFAFLSKGVAGFFFLPGLFIVALFKQHRSILTKPITYISSIMVLAVCLGYYGLREWVEPGFWAEVWGVEIGRISSPTLDWHVRPFWFYMVNLVKDFFFPFVLLLPLLVVVLIGDKDNKLFKVSLALLLSTLSYLLLISIPSVKLEWYDAPIYPALAILVAIGLITTLERIRALNTTYRLTLATVITLALCLPNFLNILTTQNNLEAQIEAFEMEGAYLMKTVESHPQIKRLTVFKMEDNVEHYDQLLFYKRALEKKGNYDIRIAKTAFFSPGEILLVSQDKCKELVHRLYRTQSIKSWPNGTELLSIDRRFH